MLPLQGAYIRSPVRELRSLMPHSAAKKGKKDKEFIWQVVLQDRDWIRVTAWRRHSDWVVNKKQQQQQKKNILSTQGVILLIRITAEKHILRISVMSVLGWLCLCLSPSPRCPWVSGWCTLGLVPWKNWRGSTPTRPVGEREPFLFSSQNLCLLLS